ncbi:hypothetical protein AB0C96_13720 [Streptomyces sp. NPDC048506]|uniref:hypothetical protein n=1 Tax=Streptomyces sp. NPDC048506 TaxID=3155028 RepID=UPI003430A8C3
MTYFMYTTMGESIDEPDASHMRRILSELQNADDEHSDVSLNHESGWSLTVYPDKGVLWENVEDADVPPREAVPASWDDVVALLLEISQGNFAAVESIDWTS